MKKGGWEEEEEIRRMGREGRRKVDGQMRMKKGGWDEEDEERRMGSGG